MSLHNLVGVALEPVEPSPLTVARLLAGARRHIADAQASVISSETRFGSAYTAIGVTRFRSLLGACAEEHRVRRQRESILVHDLLVISQPQGKCYHGRIVITPESCDG